MANETSAEIIANVQKKIDARLDKQAELDRQFIADSVLASSTAIRFSLRYQR
jgi:hypothetical protein